MLNIIRTHSVAVDKSDDIVATVNCNGRDIGHELVAAGLAKYVQWSAPKDNAFNDYCIHLRKLE